MPLLLSAAMWKITFVFDFLWPSFHQLLLLLPYSRVWHQTNLLWLQLIQSSYLSETNIRDVKFWGHFCLFNMVHHSRHLKTSNNLFRDLCGENFPSNLFNITFELFIVFFGYLKNLEWKAQYSHKCVETSSSSFKAAAWILTHRDNGRRRSMLLNYGVTPFPVRVESVQCRCPNPLCHFASLHVRRCSSVSEQLQCSHSFNAENVPQSSLVRRQWNEWRNPHLFVQLGIISARNWCASV